MLGFLFQLVAPTGFEPAISALRGRRPKPLDDGTTLFGWGGRSRTLTYGTRNRCPTIRRHPNGLTMTRLNILVILSSCVKHQFPPFLDLKQNTRSIQNFDSHSTKNFAKVRVLREQVDLHRIQSKHKYNTGDLIILKYSWRLQPINGAHCQVNGLRALIYVF